MSDKDCYSKYGHLRDAEEGLKAYQGGALHDGLLTAVRKGHGELGEVHEHLRHFVAALAAADVDDAVAVAVLGQRLADHRLAAPERPRNRAGACIRN